QRGGGVWAEENDGGKVRGEPSRDFAKLYELDNDPKRKEFLDELFVFMQKRGTPVNRIPIMAKQVLDLYKLYTLVTEKGGLVEVINKKIWREITKGLNLPTSITSAAFTLRTQYMKYLYPFECEKKGLSSPGELQAAIDSNRREGRRPSYTNSLYRYCPSPSSALLSSSVQNTPTGHNGLSTSASPKLKKKSGLFDEVSPPVMASRVPMALALGQQQQQHQQLAQAATLEHLKERLERGAAADCPEKKMLQLAEEQQRLMQQALQQNLLALASHFNPMNLKLNNGHESKQDLSMNITANGAASINVSVELNGTVYTGGRTFGAFGIMPYQDEEYPGQPLWQSVTLFFCKGMIEGIMVILFFWLLVQVLFTKQLEVHLQVLLLVGLVVFCLCLLLGCILCWRNRQAYPAKVEFVAQPDTNRAPAAAAEQKEQPKSYFSLRRFRTPPLTSPLYKPIDPGHASLPSFPRFGLSKTCKALKRRCTVTGSTISHNEHSRLTSPSMARPLPPEEPIPLLPLNYRSTVSCQQPLSPKPCLHFTLAFSPEERTLAVTVLGLSGTSHGLEDVSVLGRLPPLYPCPLQASAHKSPSPEAPSLLLLLKVSSVQELQRCVLKLTVYTQKNPSLKSTVLGDLETECRGRDWRVQKPFLFKKELNQIKWKLQEDQVSDNSARTSSSPPQIFVLLQYQTLAHRIKAGLLQAHNLDRLHGTSAPAGLLLQERRSNKCPQAQLGIIHQESGRGRLSAAGQFHLNSLEALGLASTHLSDLL
ncbi:unnamed protein product, partial [Tetraodon nigroviridis]